nr:hypothetical protein Iba_chr13dCG0630 [Ipomoea batatas]
MAAKLGVVFLFEASVFPVDDGLVKALIGLAKETQSDEEDEEDAMIMKPLKIPPHLTLSLMQSWPEAPLFLCWTEGDLSFSSSTTAKLSLFLSLTTFEPFPEADDEGKVESLTPPPGFSIFLDAE